MRAADSELKTGDTACWVVVYKHGIVYGSYGDRETARSAKNHLNEISDNFSHSYCPFRIGKVVVEK